MNPVYVGDEVIDGMINGNKDMAIVYSGDATNILLENEEMKIKFLTRLGEIYQFLTTQTMTEELNKMV